MNKRSIALRQQGLRDSIFAVLTAGLALAASSGALAALGCVLALGLVLYSERGVLFRRLNPPGRAPVKA